MRKIIYAAAVTCTLLGCNYAYAKIIPGIDEPFDPPNYYSETSISYADTANPSFFYRDLAHQGMQVRDVTRIAKNILSAANELKHLETLQAFVNNEIINMTGMEEGKVNAMQVNIEAINQNTFKLQKAAAVGEATDEFRSTQTANDPRHIYSEYNKLKVLDKNYENILDAAQNNIVDTDLRLSILTDGIENANTSKGEVEANQSNTQIQAIYDSEVARRNSMMANYAALEYLHSLYDTDANLESAEHMKSSFGIRVSNPYSPDKTDTDNYERPKGNGFIKF